MDKQNKWGGRRPNQTGRPRKSDAEKKIKTNVVLPGWMWAELDALPDQTAYRAVTTTIEMLAKDDDFRIAAEEKAGAAAPAPAGRKKD